MKRSIARLAGEIADIRHAYNNHFNTLSGYTELALEARRTKKAADYRFFVNRLLHSLPDKTAAIRKLAERLVQVQNRILEI